VATSRQHSPDFDLTDIVWEWERRTDNGGLGVLIRVPEPEKYGLLFNKDGTFSATLDCNSASGNYATDGIGGIFMELESLTTAECGSDSLSNEMINMFGPAEDYIYEEDGRVVVFKWTRGGPWDRFRQADTSPATSISESVEAGIVGLIWDWVAFQDTAGLSDLTIENPEKYTLSLLPDSSAAIQADCNQLNWPYTLDGGSLTFDSLGPSTLVFCGEESLDQQYISFLAETVTYVTEGDTLFLNLIFDSGNMVFAPATDLTITPTPEAGILETDENGINELPDDYIQLDLQGLAQSYEWQVVKGSQIPQGPGGRGFPDHIVLGFDGEDPLNVPYTERRIMYLFPINAYVDLYSASGNNVVLEQVQRLEELIGQADNRLTIPEGVMPLLPPPSSLMDRWVQFTDLNFDQGQGVRYVSDSPFRQSIGLWTNDTMDYYYQGLAEDSRYYISLKWPVATTILPNTLNDASEEQIQQAGQSRESYDGYVSDLNADLNGQGPADWEPNLLRLDAMMNSLTFKTP
jgi:heat shock protein HslJ